MLRPLACIAAALLLGVTPVCRAAADASVEFVRGDVELTSAGPLAFAPEGVLLVSDPLAAAVYAVKTGDQTAQAAQPINVQDVRGKVAALLGVEPADIRIADMAVNPESGQAYLSVARGAGADADAVVLRVDAQGQLSELSLSGANHTKAVIPNSPAAGADNRGDRNMTSVTDIAYLDGKVLIAGLSNEEFASKLHYLDYPFDKIGAGASVEIFHGAHGRVETRSPVMSFCGYTIGGEPHVLAAYTCTPLVAFPANELQAGAKVRGKTVAELGNMNRPLDMFAYSHEGGDYLLMANDRRGMMKVDLADIASVDPIENPVRGGGTAGLPFESLAEWQGVVQLDRLDDNHALLLMQDGAGAQHLVTKPLP